MRFTCLGSGSRGNATLVEADGTRVLVDCGFSLRELGRRLISVGVEPDSLDAVLVTHEHSDHIRGVASLAGRLGIPAWMTHGTARRFQDMDRLPPRIFNGHESFSIGALEVRPYPVPHDAAEPAQFVFAHGRRRFGMLTDAGTITPHIIESLGACDALLLECNHDSSMLAGGPYPPRLKARVGGAWGHLSNAQAAGLLARLDPGRLRHVLAAHLSEQNNTPALAREALAGAAPGLDGRIAVAHQDRPGAWFEV